MAEILLVYAWNREWAKNNNLTVCNVDRQMASYPLITPDFFPTHVAK